MPKPVSVAAQRRTVAKLKAQSISKSSSHSSATSAAAVPKRRTTKTSASAPDPMLASEPAEFESGALKFVMAPPAPKNNHEVPAYEYLGELPDSYGTKKLFLVARDPHWLYSYWDLTDGQFMEATQAAHDGKIFLELFKVGAPERLQQIQIPRGVKAWYLQAISPDTHYVARLGYYRQDGGFEEISVSPQAYAPRDTFSWKTQAKFVTIPFHISFRELFEMIRSHLNPGEELAEGLARLQEEGFPFSFNLVPSKTQPNDPSGVSEAILNHLGEDFIKISRVGSMEISEIVRRRMDSLRSSGQWINSESSPMGASFGSVKDRQFFMHVNAELIIYGGTDPRANVQINGQPIKLRSDGTFSYHFVLPDGRYFIPVEATAPDGLETRAAMLSFLRMSDYTGDVKATGQTPRPEPLGRQE